MNVLIEAIEADPYPLSPRVQLLPDRGWNGRRHKNRLRRSEAA
jgi:hypothetical protein